MDLPGFADPGTFTVMMLQALEMYRQIAMVATGGVFIGGGAGSEFLTLKQFTYLKEHPQTGKLETPATFGSKSRFGAPGQPIHIHANGGGGGAGWC